jgi:hypothetical protein
MLASDAMGQVDTRFRLLKNPSAFFRLPHPSSTKIKIDNAAIPSVWFSF